jgi:hypothetical protein
LKLILFALLFTGLCIAGPIQSSALPSGDTLSEPLITSIDFDVPEAADTPPAAPQVFGVIADSTVFPQDAPPEFGDLIPEPSFTFLVIAALVAIILFQRYHARPSANLQS